MDVSNETREEVMHAPNLFDFFCGRTAEETIERGSHGIPAQATSYAGIILVLLASLSFWIFGKPGLARAAFVVFALLTAWTVWGAVIRSSEKMTEKADSIRGGVFPSATAPYVLARLKWWNHLIVPRRWGRHSRLFDRRVRLERRIRELENEITEKLPGGEDAAQYAAPADEEIEAVAEAIQSLADRRQYEKTAGENTDPVARLRAELILYKGLLLKLLRMAATLDRIEALSLVFHTVDPEDLTQVVGDAIQLLEERRLLVLNVDAVEPGDFVNLVAVRTT